ncbi:hypothetical protein SOVF_094550, partial [Spinacia oleracea]
MQSKRILKELKEKDPPTSRTDEMKLLSGIRKLNSY